MAKIKRNLPNNQYLAALLANSPSTSNVFATIADLVASGGSSTYASKLQHNVKYAEQINKGQAVYVSSADGTNMIVSKADNSNESTSSKTMGLVLATGNANYQGVVITEGLLDGLNTSLAQDGDTVWLGKTGNLLFGLINKPKAPDHLVFIGIVTRVNANNGEIFVKVQNGFELHELHDVLVPSYPFANYIHKGVLYRDANENLWKHDSIQSLLGYTPANESYEINTEFPLMKSAGDLSGPGITLGIGQASTEGTGYLSSTDWNTFNNKVATTRTISTTSPLTGGGDLSANRTLSIPKATTAIDGYLSAADWTIFNGKQAALGFTPANIAGATFTGDIFATNLLGTNTGDETLTTIKTKLGAASASQDGYLTSANWSTFNNKQDTLTYTPANKAGETFTGNISATNLSGTNTGDETTATIKTKLGAATSTLDGYLLATDWIIFNTKVATSVTISTTAPLQGGGDLSNNRTLSITQAGVTTDGFLSSTDWNTFSNKQNSINLTTTGTSGAATFDGSTLNIPQYTGSGVSEKSGTVLGTSRSLPFRMATGITTYRSASGVGSTTISSTTFAGESTHYYPISLKEGSPVRAAAFRVNSAGSGGLGTAEMEIGIYNATINANGELIPGTLEVQFGKVSVLSTGVKEAVLASPYTLGATVDNIYWIAIRSYSTNSTSLNIYSTTDVLSSWIGMSSSTALVKLGMFIATTPYTAPTGLPASLPVTGGVGFTQTTTVAGYTSSQLLIGLR